MALHKIVDVSQGVVALLDEILTCALFSGQDDDIIKLKTSVQLDIVHHEAADTARTAGLEVVMDRCPKIEHQRLMA